MATPASDSSVPFFTLAATKQRITHHLNQICRILIECEVYSIGWDLSPHADRADMLSFVNTERAKITSILNKLRNSLNTVSLTRNTALAKIQEIKSIDYIKGLELAYEFESYIEAKSVDSIVEHARSLDNGLEIRLSELGIAYSTYLFQNNFSINS